MVPIQMQAGARGVGMGYEQFVETFAEICQEHLAASRARIFAFVFYDMENSTVRRALREADGFHRLNQLTGKEISLFYLHDSAAYARWSSFNRVFMDALGIADQAKTPCIVFFRVHDSEVEDVSIYAIDERTRDPILIVAELENYVNDAKQRLTAEGNLSGLLSIGKVFAPLGLALKLSEFLIKLKGLS